jgi:hypothetical protein
MKAVFKTSNIEHPTPNIQCSAAQERGLQPASTWFGAESLELIRSRYSVQKLKRHKCRAPFFVGCWMFDVECWMFRLRT